MINTEPDYSLTSGELLRLLQNVSHSTRLAKEYQHNANLDVEIAKAKGVSDGDIANAILDGCRKAGV